MGFLKKIKKNKGGGTSTSSHNGSRRPAPQDSTGNGVGSTLGNGSSYLGSTMNAGSSSSGGGGGGGGAHYHHRTAAAEEEHDYHYRGKNPHRRMNKEHVHHRPSASAGGAAAATGGAATGAAAALATPTAGNSHSHSNPSMALIPGLVRDLETAATASGDVPARALRTLFSLSEHGGGNNGGGGGSTTNGGSGGKTPSESESNRTAMVRQGGGRLVPVLLSFLRRCERGSSEQYLALLVLNNISIPSDNKRVSFASCAYCAYCIGRNVMMYVFLREQLCPSHNS